MALTKVSGGILDPGIDVAGIVTATGFDGPFTGGSSKNITAGIITATGFDLNGNGDISGNLVIGGNLTANGDFTTLNTTLREVEILRVDANSNSIVGVAVTQSGTADLVNLFDGATKVVTVDDVGNVGLGSAIPSAKLDVVGTTTLGGQTTIAHTAASQLIIKDSDTSGTNSQQRISFRDSANTEMFFVGNDTTNSWLYLGSPSGQNNNVAFRINGNDRFQVNGNGAEVVGGSLYIPDSIIHVGDPDTKIRFPDADTFAIDTAGSERFEINSGGTGRFKGGALLLTNGRLNVNYNIAHSSTYYLDNDAHILVSNGDSAGTKRSVLKLGGEAALVYGGGSSSLIIADVPPLTIEGSL